MSTRSRPFEGTSWDRLANRRFPPPISSRGRKTCLHSGVRTVGDRPMRTSWFLALSAATLLLLVAACASTGPVAVTAASDGAPPPVDLGASSRIPHIVGSAGEGEGYGMVQTTSAAHASMGGMSHEPASTMAKASMPPAGQSMDHSKMDHGATPSVSHSPAAAPQMAQAAHVQGTGTVKAIDPVNRKVNLSHNAIPTIGWPAMTMDFAVGPSVDLEALKPGARVNFMMDRSPDGMYVIQSITLGGGQ